MADGVGDGNGAALRMAEEGKFLEAGGVHNNFQIMDPGFEGNVFDVPGGETIAAAVVAEDAGAAGEIAHPMMPDGTFPFEVEVIETVCDSDEGLPRADGGVGEANVVLRDAEANFLAGLGRGFSDGGKPRRNGVGIR